MAPEGMPPDKLIDKLCPTDSVGVCWLKATGVVLEVPAVALIIPQDVMSVEQTVIAAEPLVLLVVKVTVEPFIPAWITEELELFKTV